MIKLKTKRKVIVEPITMREDFVYVEVENLVIDTKGATGSVCYYTLNEVEETTEVIKRVAIHISSEEIDQLERVLGISGTTVLSKVKDLIRKVMRIKLDELKVFGLNVNDLSEI